MQKTLSFNHRTYLGKSYVQVLCSFHQCHVPLKSFEFLCSITSRYIADTAAATPAPAPAPSVASVPGSNTSQEFKRFQQYMALMKATEDLDVGFAQVGTAIKKKVHFVSVENKPGK